MKQMSLILAMVAICSLLFSCQEKVKESSMWGVTQYYPDFLWDKYEPVIMEQTLEFDFNDDAQRLLADEVFTFEVVELDENGNAVPDQFVVYKNGTQCDNATFTVTTADKEVRLGLEFLPDAREGNHKFYLREKGTSGLTSVEYSELAEGVYIKKDNDMNPLAEGSAWGGSTLLIVLVAWLIVSRLIFWPAVSFSRIEIDYHDGAGFRRIRTSGCYEVVLTNDKKKSDNLFAKIFKGSRKYEEHEFWATPVVIKSGMRKTIRITSHRRHFTSEPLRPMRRDEFTLTNSDGKSVTLRSN